MVVALLALAWAAGRPQPALALDNGLARTPPMGWNGFPHYTRDVTDAIARAQARTLVTSGMKDAGYEYVNLDGGWALLERDAEGRLRPNPARFPDGLKPLVSHDGVAFTWPDTAAGQPDNVVAQGQTVALSGRGAKLAFLGASSDDPTGTGSGTVYYTDGSTSSYSLTLYGFWNKPPGDADDVIAAMPYVNSQGIGGRPRGQRPRTVYVFYASAPIDPGKTVAAVTLPSGGSTGPGRISGMHFFAAGVG